MFFHTKHTFNFKLTRWSLLKRVKKNGIKEKVDIIVSFFFKFCQKKLITLYSIKKLNILLTNVVCV